MANSEEFAALDGLYHVLAKGQEENWDIWWNYAKKLPAIDRLKKQRLLLKYINGEIDPCKYRPAVLSSGLIAMNRESFIFSYYAGTNDFFDFF